MQPAIDRSKKPERRVLWTPVQLKEKEANLQPIFGAEVSL
jgi:hypothetical protein